MAETPATARQRLSDLLADPTLVRAVASGAQRCATPRWRRVEIRPVELKAGCRLQVTAYDATQAHISNLLPTELDSVLDEPFSNWHIETTTETHQMRVTKKGGVLWQRRAQTDPVTVDTAHDRIKQRLIAADAPFLAELGITDQHGRVKPSRQAKYRQVEEFVRVLAVAVSEAVSAGHLRTPSAEQPLRVADLGCGNAYLTFAAQHWFEHVAALPAVLIGVDVKEQSAQHNRAVAARLGVEHSMSFVVSAIDRAAVDDVDIVLALHACDTATDDALAAAVHWGAAVILAAPCCHHDVARQLRAVGAPAPYGALIRDGILRERFADTLTDALRASLLRQRAYRVDVVDFIDSAHTPRNTLLRAVRTGVAAGADAAAETAALTAQWSVEPRLAALLAD